MTVPETLVSKVETDVGSMYVESTGRGPTLFCWPSLFCDGRTMGAQVEALSASYQVIVVDGPGHSRSGPPRGPFSLEDCADAAVRVLDAAGVDRAVFVGSAWGGHVGVAAALRAPHRFRALVVMNTPMQAWTGSLRLKFWFLLQLFRKLGARRFLIEAITHAQLSPAVRAAHPERVEIIANCIRSSERGGFLDAVQSGMLDRPSLLSRLGALSLPTLFITGALDSMLPIEEARKQAAAVSRSRFEVVAGTAHSSAYEDPVRVNALLQDFLRSLPAETSPAERRMAR